MQTSTPNQEVRPLVSEKDFRTARRLIGLMGGTILFVSIAAIVWGMKTWEANARQRAEAAVTEPKPAKDPKPNPPNPALAAGHVENQDPITQPVSPTDFAPKTFPRIQPETNFVPRYGEPLPPLSNDVLTMDESLVLRNIHAPHEGVVKDVFVKLGEKVKAGDRLVQLSSFSLDWQLVKVKSQLETAKVQLTAIQQKKLRAEKLKDANAIPVREFLDFATDEKLTEIEIKTYTQQLELLTTAQKELTIIAPVAGIVQHHWHTKNFEASLLGVPFKRGSYLLGIGPLPDPNKKTKPKKEIGGGGGAEEIIIPPKAKLGTPGTF